MYGPVELQKLTIAQALQCLVQDLLSPNEPISVMQSKQTYFSLLFSYCKSWARALNPSCRGQRFSKCNFNITNVEFHFSTSLLPAPKSGRISLPPRLAIPVWATWLEMHQKFFVIFIHSSKDSCDKKTNFFSSPSPTIQNFFFLFNEKENWQHGGKTISAFPRGPWIPTHCSLPWWFREMRLDGSWKPGSTRSRRPWAEVWSTLS